MLADMLRHINRGEFEPVVITLFYWERRDYFYELIPPDVPVHRLAFKGFIDLRSWIKLYSILRTESAKPYTSERAATVYEQLFLRSIGQ